MLVYCFISNIYWLVPSMPLLIITRNGSVWLKLLFDWINKTMKWRKEIHFDRYLTVWLRCLLESTVYFFSCFFFFFFFCSSFYHLNRKHILFASITKTFHNEDHHELTREKKFNLNSLWHCVNTINIAFS